MGCSRGKAAPSSHTKLRLFADSAGFCQRPNCGKRLFSEAPGPDYHIAEMAHILAASKDGPRANAAMTEEERGSYENLILLCPNCHTEIDKAPDAFPDDVVLRWKRDHIERVRQLFDVAKYGTRAEARSAIEPLLRANEVVFREFGPDRDYRSNPEAEEAVVWQRKMLSQVIPNNRAILLILDTNVHLLYDEEINTLERFKQHVDDLTERHLGQNRTRASRFPADMQDILK